MRILVDFTKCRGYAQCGLLGPDVFKIQGDEALTYNPNPDSTQLTPIRRAAPVAPGIRVQQNLVGIEPAPAAASTGPCTR
jgi:ferredoxin